MPDIEFDISSWLDLSYAFGVVANTEVMLSSERITIDAIVNLLLKLVSARFFHFTVTIIFCVIKVLYRIYSVYANVLFFLSHLHLLIIILKLLQLEWQLGDYYYNDHFHKYTISIFDIVLLEMSSETPGTKWANI